MNKKNWWKKCNKMAGMSSFNHANRTLLIDYDVDQVMDDVDLWQYETSNGISETEHQIFDHDPQSLIKWRVYFRWNDRIIIEPVDSAVNKIFKYNLIVTINGKPKNYGPAVYNGKKFEFRFPNFPVRWIQIKIIYQLEAINQIAPVPVIKSKVHLPKMITNTRSRDKFADVQFIVEDKVIVGHKVILSDRSEVFYKMFMWNMDNATAIKDTEPIPIADVSYEGFNHFIDAIYFGVTPTDPKIGLEIISLAEKYDIQDIKTAVEESIITSINMENAINILINAYLNNAERMKKAALEFCATSPMHEMNGSKELAKFPDLLNEVFKQISLTKKL